MRRSELAYARFRKVLWVRCNDDVVHTCSALTLKMSECRQRLARVRRRTPLLGEWCQQRHQVSAPAMPPGVSTNRCSRCTRIAGGQTAGLPCTWWGQCLTLSQQIPGGGSPAVEQPAGSQPPGQSSHSGQPPDQTAECCSHTGLREALQRLHYLLNLQPADTGHEVLAVQRNMYHSHPIFPENLLSASSSVGS